MNINNNFNIIAKNLFIKNKTRFLKKYNNLTPLKADTISFGGNIQTEKNPADFEVFREIMLSLDDDLLTEDLIEQEYNKYMNTYKIIKGDNNEDFETVIKEMKIFGDKYPIEKFALHIAESCDLDELIGTIKGMVSAYRMAGYNVKMDNIINAYPFAKLLLIENGILNSRDLNKYLESIDAQLPSASKKNESHYIQIQIFSRLDNKKDLGNFKELLVYASNGGETGYIDSDFNPNDLTSFLKSIGVKNTDDFNKKFDYLAEKYNDFENIWDTYNAIQDIRREYPEKIKFLKGLAVEFPDKINAKNEEDFAEIYAKHNNIVDYIYSRQKNKDYEEKAGNYVDFLANIDKLPEKTIKEITKTETSNSSETLFDAMEILAETNITIDEVNFITQNALISDNDLLDCIINKEETINRISDTEGISTDDAKLIYLNFASEYNALIKKSKKEESPSDFEELIGKDKVIEEFTNILKRYGVLNKASTNLKYNASFKDLLFKLGFGNNFNGKKQITSARFLRVTEMLQLFESFEKIAEKTESEKEVATKEKNKINKRYAKKSNSKEISSHKFFEAIKREKDIFDITKLAITDYLNKDESGYFSGKNILEIYRIVRNAQNNSNETNKAQIFAEVKSILDYYKNGHEFDLELNNKLERLIPDKKLLNQFKINNEISLIANDTNRDKEYIENYLKVLSAFGRNIEKYGDAIKYFCNSDFIKLSKNGLTKFFEKYNDPDTQREIFTGIAKAEIVNINSFNRFIKKYSDKDGGFDNLIKFLNSLPKDMNYEKFTNEFIVPLRQKLDLYNLPEIDNSNILNINTNNIKPLKEYKQSELIEIFNQISGAGDDKNFISALSGLYEKEEEFIPLTKGAIISEYLICQDKVPYQHLDKVITPYGRQIFSEMLRGGQKYRASNDFYDLINDTSWIKADDDNVYNMSLHAKMRFIDRFIMPEINNIKELYTSKTKEKMKKLISDFYDECLYAEPNNISLDNKNGRISVTFERNSDNIKVNLSNEGNLVTVFKKYEH